jgi:diphthamide biosynthesis methyltransferase
MSIQAITVTRVTGNGKNTELLDVCEELGKGDFGSPTNALIVLARKSDLYQETVEKLRNREPKRDAASDQAAA